MESFKRVYGKDETSRALALFRSTSLEVDDCIETGHSVTNDAHSNRNHTRGSWQNRSKLVKAGSVIIIFTNSGEIKMLLPYRMKKITIESG